MKNKLVLIGGYPKGYDEPFHIKTKSGKVLRKIVSDLRIEPIYFDLWKDEEEENSRILNKNVKKELSNFIENNYILIALGRYIEKALVDNNCKCIYLPHPASRDIKYQKKLKDGLIKIIGSEI